MLHRLPTGPQQDPVSAKVVDPLMSGPTSDAIFTLMGCGFRRDRYAKAGNGLLPHRHDFDHGVYVERGSVRVASA